MLFKMNKDFLKKWFLSMLIFVGVMLIISFAIILILIQMNERIITLCEKQNYSGEIHFWDADVNCEELSGITNISLFGRPLK